MKKNWGWILGGLALVGAALWYFLKGSPAGGQGPAPDGATANTRGERNNNPCNVTPLVGDTWQGQTGVDTSGDTPYCIFDTPRNGIRAAGVNALTIFETQSTLTLEQFGSYWQSGSTSANPAYGDQLASFIGIDSSTPFSVPQSLESLLKAISNNENSEVPYTEADWSGGVADALSYKGYS